MRNTHFHKKLKLQSPKHIFLKMGAFFSNQFEYFGISKVKNNGFKGFPKSQNPVISPNMIYQARTI